MTEIFKAIDRIKPESMEGALLEHALRLLAGKVEQLEKRFAGEVFKCSQCGDMKSDCAPDEGDGGWWCRECREKWEKANGQHWEDGSPLKPGPAASGGPQGEWDSALKKVREANAGTPGVCALCGGTGGVDSGGMTPWSSGISVPCPNCTQQLAAGRESAQQWRELHALADAWEKDAMKSRDKCWMAWYGKLIQLRADAAAPLQLRESTAKTAAAAARDKGEGMSDWKHAYGWIGHILVSNEEMDSNPDDNLIAVPALTFRRILKDYEEATLDPRIIANRLGVIDSDFVFLACGHGFSEGFKHFGTVFIEAELKAEGQPLAEDRDAAYLTAMKEIYGLTLPPCRIMVGCASEH